MTEGRPPSPRLLALAMLAVVVLMSVCYPAIKAGLPYAPPLRFGGLRTSVAGLALLIAALITRRPLWPGRRLAVRIIPLGLLSTSLVYALMFASPSFADAGLATVFGNTQPLFVAGFAFWLVGERIPPRRMMGLGLGFGGILTLTLPMILQSERLQLTGGLLALGASCAGAAAGVWMKKLRPGRGILAITGWQLLFGGAVLLACSVFAEPGRSVEWSGRFVTILAVLALGGTAVATFLWYWCLQHAAAGKLASYLFLIPVIGVLISILWHHERPTVLQIAGMALTAASVGWVASPRSRGPQP